MRSIKRIICPVLLLAWALQVNGISASDSLRYEVLMSSGMLKTLNLDANFIGDFDITPERHVLLATNSQAFLLGWGGMNPLGKPSQAAIASFAFTSDGLLMVVRNNEICYYDSLGVLSSLYKLPYTGMGISAGKKSMYIFDRSTGKTNKAVFEISPGGKYKIVFELNSPIASVAELNNSLLFATKNLLCQFDLATKEYKVLAALSNEKTIRSVTADASGNRIYFSTDREIYAVSNNSAITISKELGGILKFYSGGLMVFDPGKKFLIRIAGIEKELAMAESKKPVDKAPAAVDILTNSTVTDLVRTELPDPLIIAIIKRSKVNFNLGVDDIIDLAGKGVSSDVIMEMRQAMKRQSSQVPVK